MMERDANDAHPPSPAHRCRGRLRRLPRDRASRFAALGAQGAADHSSACTAVRPQPNVQPVTAGLRGVSTRALAHPPAFFLLSTMMVRCGPSPCGSAGSRNSACQPPQRFGSERMTPSNASSSPSGSMARPAIQPRRTCMPPAPSPGARRGAVGAWPGPDRTRRPALTCCAPNRGRPAFIPGASPREGGGGPARTPDTVVRPRTTLARSGLSAAARKSHGPTRCRLRRRLCCMGDNGTPNTADLLIIWHDRIRRGFRRSGGKR